MGTPGCGGFATSACTGSSRSLGPTVVTTAASTAGDSPSAGPVDGPGSRAAESVVGIEFSGVSSGFGGALGVSAPEGDWITEERAPVRDARTASLGLATGGAGRSTVPAGSRSASPLSLDSTYSRSSGAEPVVWDVKVASPTPRTSSACSNTETAPAQRTGRSVGPSGPNSTVAAAEEPRSWLSSSAGADTVPPRELFGRSHGCPLQPCCRSSLRAKDSLLLDVLPPHLLTKTLGRGG